MTQVDRTTFNYGRAMGKPRAVETAAAPWEDKQAAREYDTIEHFTRGVAKVANEFSARAWALEMALRDVRNACSPVEQAAAMADLRAMFHEVDRALDRVEAAPVRFYRYGRAGDVLRRYSFKGEPHNGKA